MKIVVAFAIIIAFLSQTLTKVTRVNQFLKEAQAAYKQKDYTTAIYLFKYLSDSLQVREREVKINLGHAYFQRNNQEQASRFYQPLLAKSTPRVASLLHLQLGVITASKNKTQALDYFKKALILNPQNEEARYNYEFLKKYLKQHPEADEPALPPPAPEKQKPQDIKPEQAKQTGQKEDAQGKTQAEVPDFNNSDPENSPQPGSGKNPETDAANGSRSDLSNKASANQQKKDSSGNLPGNQRGVSGGNNPDNNRNQINSGQNAENQENNAGQTTFDHLKEVGITPEKARMLLEAMREAEVQYLQQIPRKHTPKKDSGNPDW
ncbi:tetratricopeptide repeat protein [Adhaeribacter swui]|uniref:Tetratricopeptide repeat protein n=1 Tax=Adhaeribacter swui TaxID=2086471 RepID=A0A7G7GE38_9BACT|nr:tetratricopeptide repeat protein [Adhaeribacter swui]QNF35422.1 tetratricopeptide repeat protein [Adhaeribacter swui]